MKLNFILWSDVEERKNIRGRGGVGTHLFELSQALADLGNNATVLVPSTSSWSVEIKSGFTMMGISSSGIKGLGIFQSR